MALLATEIIKQDVRPENIPVFISTVRADLQNPVTQNPFEWDAQNKALFYIRPGSDTKVEFHLNL
jgi:hypothetical protein